MSPPAAPPPPYVDTSALAKWYLNEPGSDEFEAYIRRRPGAIVSRLAAVELRCLLARRRRAGDIAPEIEAEAYRLFERDVGRGHLDLRPLDDAHAVAALDLLDGRLRHHPLRTLDALHLAAALAASAAVIATADRVMGRAAADLGLDVATFG